MSHTASSPDPGEILALNQALYDRLTAPVPEPAAWATLLFAWLFGSLGAAARRKK